MKKNDSKKKNYSISFDALDEQAKELYNGIFQEFDLISIYELREVARKMGVRSATTMDKKTLVKTMTDFRMASTVYYPPEKSAVSPVTYKDVEEITADYLKRRLVLNPEKRTGILDFDSNGAWLRVHGFAPSDDDVFVPMLMVNEHELRAGDEISGKARFMENCGRFGLILADTVNGQKFAGFVRKKLSDPQPAGGIIEMKSGSRVFDAMNAVCPFSKGQRRLILGLGALKLDSLAREISRQLSALGLLTVNLFLDVAPESIVETNALAGKNLVLPCENHCEYDKSILLATSYAKSIAPYGKDVVIILNNADILKESTLREVYAAGRSTECGSITTVIISSSLVLSETLNRLSRTASAVTVFANNYGDEPLIDTAHSFSDSERELPPAWQQSLRDIRKKYESPVCVREIASACEILRERSKTREQ